MNTTTRRLTVTPRTEQLSLFPSAVPDRFRLDDATRRRGLRHVAKLRAQLEARYPSTPSPPADPHRRLAPSSPAGGRAA